MLALYVYVFVVLVCYFCTTNSSDPTSTINVLTIIPGFGFHAERTVTVLRNLDIISRSNISVHCMIFIYGSNHTESILQHINSLCDVQMYYHANFANYIKSVAPQVVKLSRYSHVMILLDDVELIDPFRYVLWCSSISLTSYL